MSRGFDEDSRVKLPAILHFRRLGYTYQTNKVDAKEIDKSTNIFRSLFQKGLEKINGRDFSETEIEDIIKEIKGLTESSIDKGQGFFDRLIKANRIALIDFEDFSNNDFYVVPELPYGNEKATFRPDITILINGIPVSFMEVKKPNNYRSYTNKKGKTKSGMQAEFLRMEDRFAEPVFQPYFNQMQLLSFSNNQSYDDGEIEPLRGSFYTTPNGENTKYNHFREEAAIPVSEYLDDDFVKMVLRDNNKASIISDTEFIFNLKTTTPCNEFITSLYSLERLEFFLKFGIVYVNSIRDGLNKHIIRYPQYFALQELINCKLDTGVSRTVLWHTQGSGKTAFAYFATNVLRKYFGDEKIVTKFYFVVDRLDLLRQAKVEFGDRGMSITTIDSREDFIRNIQSTSRTGYSSQRGDYKETMNVVNIQKFTAESTIDYDVDRGIQRIYFIDEAHRGYKDDGTFLANLLGADPKGIFIALTGTPILSKRRDEGEEQTEKKTDRSSTAKIFMGYLHKYYYNRSIADGYTLKIKKESIAIDFKADMKRLLNISGKKDIPARKWEELTYQPEYIEQLCKYIEDDFRLFREVSKDESLGFMIVTTGTKQAYAIQKWFENNSQLKTCLVLSKEDDNIESTDDLSNSQKQENFRGIRNKGTGKVESQFDGMVVFKMCITGYDAPRLKRLYLLREISEHGLLQTLARVNRPYKKMRYGHVVDFVDITEEYEETNRRYLEELKKDMLDDEETAILDMFIDVEDVKAARRLLEDKIFIYMCNIETNLEAFRHQIETMDEDALRELRSDLEEYESLYNQFRICHEDVSNMPIKRVRDAKHEVINRIGILVTARSLDDEEITNEEIDYSHLVVEFFRNGIMDLDFATEDDVLSITNEIQNAFSANSDKSDVEFVNRMKCYKGLLKKFTQETDTIQKVKEVLAELDELLKDVVALNEKNNTLTNLYKGNVCKMRVHKRLKFMFQDKLSEKQVYEVVSDIQNIMDNKIGHWASPTKSVIIRDIRRPVYLLLKRYGFADMSAKNIEDIIDKFLDNQYVDE